MQDPMVGVAGLGLLGRGIAACLVAHNIPVIAYALSQQEFDDARAAIAFAIKELIDHEAADPSLQSTWQTLYTEAASLPAFAACTFVVESIIEDAESKIKLFAELEKILSATTPVASNTSSIPISLMQKACQHPERFLGMHWAEPAYATRFLELIRGDHTNDASMKAATELGLCLGKDPLRRPERYPRFHRQPHRLCHVSGGLQPPCQRDRRCRNHRPLVPQLRWPVGQHLRSLPMDRPHRRRSTLRQSHGRSASHPVERRRGSRAHQFHDAKQRHWYAQRPGLLQLHPGTVPPPARAIRTARMGASGRSSMKHSR